MRHVWTIRSGRRPFEYRLRAAHTGCYQWIVAANIYQAVKEAMQDLVAPQLESLKGEMGALRVDVRRVEENLTNKMDSVEEKLSTEIRRVDEKLSSEIHRVDEKLSNEIHRVDEKLSNEILRVDEKLSNEIRRVDERLSTDIHRIDEKLTWALDLRERIIVLETKLATPGSGS